MMVAGDAHRPIESPSPTLPKGRGLFPVVSKAFARGSRPLGRVGEGLSEGWGGAFGGPGRGFPHKKTGEPTVTVGIPG